LSTGILMVAAISVLALLAMRLLHRRMALARLKNDMAATVSHELKTPLSSIRVLVDTLLDADDLNADSAREYLRLIAQENERLTRLIQNFLTFSRMERNQYAFHFAPVAGRQIVEAAVDTVRQRLNVPGCRFEMQLEEALPEIIADSDALATAIINLLDNAVKYSVDPRHIILRARVTNGSVIFSVQDHGVGIEPREAKKIFRQFYQVHPHLSQPDRGCGLGLSIVQFVVTAHGGRVSVETEPGRGSTFTIEVPVAATTADRRKEVVA
jgi:signal transduction histidine kinase